jgi:HEPN domain-containing protein
MNEVTSDWVFKAEEDFFAADGLLHEMETPQASAASFHCQQCAEKYLKAFLTEHRIRFERTHVLMDLLALCVPVDKDFKKLAGDLSSLESYAVAIRYPGVTTTVELAEDAFKAMERIRTFVKKKLKLK